MAEKVGTLIRNARTGAGMTQEQLAGKIKGLSAEDISNAERGKVSLTQAQLKEIARATGVTQSSLLNAAKESAASSPAPSGKKPAKTSGKSGSSAGKKPSSASAAASSTNSLKLTETEAKLVRLYRKADAKTRKAAMELLEEEKSELGGLLESLLSAAGSGSGSSGSSSTGAGSDSLTALLQTAMGMLGKK